MLIEERLSSDEKIATAKLFRNLSHDVPLSSYFPYKVVPIMKEILDTPGLSSPSMKILLRQCDGYSLHVSTFLKPFLDVGHNLVHALGFFRYVVEKLESLPFTEPDNPLTIPGSYNPPKNGCAYYFTPHGSKIRNARKFSIDGATKETADGPTTYRCNKHYPLVSQGGQTFLFLFFCPLHGHCYGFHMVGGSEGRKDPMQAMYTHLPVAPEMVFYDYACQLEEYSLNRESGYYRATRFYHDTFHGYSHKCPNCYSSKKSLADKSRYNESIMEQFNSFLQNIKASSKQMNQINFVFMAQFMISIWNEDKKKKFTKKHGLVQYL